MVVKPSAIGTFAPEDRTDSDANVPNDAERCVNAFCCTSCLAWRTRWAQEGRRRSARRQDGGGALSLVDVVGSSSSPLARIAISGCEYTKSAASRWMTFVRNPSPCPMPSANPDRKMTPSGIDEVSSSAQPRGKTSTTPIRKFVSPEPSSTSSGASTIEMVAEMVPGIQSICQGITAPPDLDRQSRRTESSLEIRARSSRLSHRMRDLYDFKTESEWPSRMLTAGNSSEKQERVWISKSSSEEDKFGTTSVIEMRNWERARKPRYGTSGSDGTVEAAAAAASSEEQEEQEEQEEEESEVFEDNLDERWSLFNERLRYSDDLGRDGHLQRQQRRTYSDDYEVKRRCNLRLVNDGRNSIGQLGVKRNSRASEASYVSVDSYVDRKGSGNECVGQMRTFKENDNSRTEMREYCEDGDNYEGVSVDRMIFELHKRASTRYKIYLT